jgi:uncharacterized repeat protein (TIGR01451 family)
MTVSQTTTFSGAMAAAVLFAVCIATPARAQVAPTVLQTKTTSDGLLTLVLSSINPSDAVDVDNTYTWTVTNNSTTVPLTGVVLGSHWGDYCIGGTATSSNCTTALPTGPTLISLSPGCGGQSPSEFPENIAVFGIWCTPGTGVTLPPGASISGSVTLRPNTGGPPNYTVYSGYNDPITKVFHPTTPVITNNNFVTPAATDIQITGAASTGSPRPGSTFTYTYQVKNAGPWGTYGGIIFVDTLPASLTYVSSSVLLGGLDRFTGQPTQFTELNGCTAVGQTVACPLQDMTNGGLAGQAAITITVTASGVPQQIVNTASVHTVLPQTDSNIANNSVTVNVTSK